MKHCLIFVILLAGLASTGCSHRVETTDDAIKVETEVPKAELGAEPVDMDVRTDDDVDIDTPAPGDR